MTFFRCFRDIFPENCFFSESRYDSNFYRKTSFLRKVNEFPKYAVNLRNELKSRPFKGSRNHSFNNDDPVVSPRLSISITSLHIELAP